MEKSYQSSGDSSSTSSNTSSAQYLKQLNKLSQKISKPPIAGFRSFDHAPLPPPPPSQVNLPQPVPLPHSQQPLQPQPPVYNINKSEFRDIVQKLTGSSAHSTPPPPPSQPPLPVLHHSKPPSSRLQRIRPPPLAHLGHRPPRLLPNTDPLPVFNLQNPNPLSPLPPLPSVHTAAESPISAYMRCINSASAPGFFESSKMSPLGFGSPRSNHPADPTVPISSGYPQLPPFGCMSPLSSTAAVNAILSPSALPLSPTIPVSPKWRAA